MLNGAARPPYPRHLPLRWKMGLAYLLTDEAYAVTIIHYNKPDTPPATRHWFFLGAGLALWLEWQVSTALGILLGARIPASWSLDFALPLTFMGLVIPTLHDRPHVAAGLSAGLGGRVTAARPPVPFTHRRRPRPISGRLWGSPIP